MPSQSHAGLKRREDPQYNSTKPSYLLLDTLYIGMSILALVISNTIAPADLSAQIVTGAK